MSESISRPRLTPTQSFRVDVARADLERIRKAPESEQPALMSEIVGSLYTVLAVLDEVTQRPPAPGTTLCACGQPATGNTTAGLAPGDPRVAVDHPDCYGQLIAAMRAPQAAVNQAAEARLVREMTQ